MGSFMSYCQELDESQWGAILDGGAWVLSVRPDTGGLQQG